MTLPPRLKIALAALLAVSALAFLAAWPRQLVATSATSPDAQWVATVSFHRWGSVGLLNRFDAVEFSIRDAAGVTHWHHRRVIGATSDPTSLLDRQEDFIRWHTAARVDLADAWGNAISLVNGPAGFHVAP
jgi:hypothetical protein